MDSVIVSAPLHIWVSQLTRMRGTWNGIGLDVSVDKLVTALQRLEEDDIGISSLIIDDGWQSVDHKTDQNGRRWKSFEADKVTFPEGLKGAVSHLRNRFPGLRHVAVWHSLIGYWRGVSPDGEIAKRYKTVEVGCEPREDGKLLVVDKQDVPQLYEDFYKFLSLAGIDAVKADSQNVIDNFVEASARRDLITTYLDAWKLSSLRHFSFRTISCMSQFPQALFYSQMATNRPTMVVRNSDDFFPNEPTSHTWHLWANAHNALFMRYLNVLPDWDMFQTSHEYGGLHAAARCVSGGPIYITDAPGEHDVKLLRQMTGKTPRGKTTVLRPSVVGRSVTHYVGFDEAQLLKVGSYHGEL